MAVKRKSRKHKAREEDLQLKFKLSEEPHHDLRTSGKLRDSKEVGEREEDSTKGLPLFIRQSDRT
jgi:hypothetical protein